jgi:hypothetical protein
MIRLLIDIAAAENALVFGALPGLSLTCLIGPLI